MRRRTEFGSGVGGRRRRQHVARQLARRKLRRPQSDGRWLAHAAQFHPTSASSPHPGTAEPPSPSTSHPPTAHSYTDPPLLVLVHVKSAGFQRVVGAGDVVVTGVVVLSVVASVLLAPSPQSHWHCDACAQWKSQQTLEEAASQEAVGVEVGGVAAAVLGIATHPISAIHVLVRQTRAAAIFVSDCGSWQAHSNGSIATGARHGLRDRCPW